MKIKITRQTFIKGKLAEVGKVLDADDRDARYLVSIGKAEQFKGPEKKKEIPSIESLYELGEKELNAMAKNCGINPKGMSRDDVILEIIDKLDGGES